MGNVKATPGEPLRELKGPKSIAYYAIMHLPTASYLRKTNDFNSATFKFKLLLYRSKEKARRGMSLINKYQLFTTSGDTISDEERKKWHHFEVIHLFTIITFPNRDKLLRMYSSLELEKIMPTNAELFYFQQHPERIKYENCI